MMTTALFALALATSPVRGTLGDDCDFQGECAEGLDCIEVESASCPTLDCPSGADCEQTECDDEVRTYCLPSACDSTSDCSGDLACLALDEGGCSEPTDPASTSTPAAGEGSDESGTSDSTDDDSADCAPESVGYCVPDYLRACESNTECDAGFVCALEEICSCSSNSGSTGAASSAGASSAPSSQSDGDDNSEGSGTGESGDDECSCEVVGDSGYCQLDFVPCNSAADCPGDLDCFEGNDSTVGTCSSDENCAPTKFCAPADYGIWAVAIGGGTSQSDSTGGGSSNLERTLNGSSANSTGSAATQGENESSGCSATGGSLGLLLALGALRRRRN